MTDTPENQPVEGAEILRILRTIDAQTRANGEQLTAIAQKQVNLARMVNAMRDDHGTDLKALREQVDSMAAVIERAAPLLESGPARALSGGLLSAVRGTRRRADG